MNSGEPDETLQNLNPPQLEAVLHETGPLLVLAGAGSGKTRVITRRIAHLYRRGLNPNRVLAITFTNKAAGEMRSRTEELSGVRSRWISTFHSLGARLLRQHAGRLAPYDSSFTIYDQADCRTLIKALLGDRGLDDDALWTAADLEKEISRIKNEQSGRLTQDGATELRQRVLQEVYALYEEALRERNAVDFDDLLLLPLRLFDEHPQVLERYQEQFQQILVDEYQDTNAVQYRLTTLLGARHRNICVTGDPDQSIYRWRGADLKNILNFEQDYPDAKVVRLEQNYRSTQNILDAANALIRHNTERKPKDLWTENGAGAAVRIDRFEDETAEAEEIIHAIEELQREGFQLGDMAILYRINALSRTLEQRLMFGTIPYTMVGGVAFYLRQEVKDVLAYLQVLANPRDSESVKRILNTPSRGIGKATLAKLEERARSLGRTLLEVVLEDDLSFLAKRSANAVREFRSLYGELEGLQELSVGDVVRGVIERTGYVEHIEKRFPQDYKERVLNVGELISAARDFDREELDRQAEDEPAAAETGGEEPSRGGLIGFLEQALLLGDIDRWEEADDRLTLMTLHAAKGLEFPVVFIVAVEDGILPLERADHDDVEEERRLLYVGLTRAQKRLYLSHVKKRLRFGELKLCYPSKFFKEMMGTHETEERVTRLQVDAATWNSLVDQGSARRARWGASWNRDEEASDDFGADYDDLDDHFTDDFHTDEDPYPVGSRIYHDDYGEGTISRVSRVGRRVQVTVDFDEAGTKRLFPAFTLLRRIR